ncbi:hypothetical protein ACFLZI_01570 [Nitrospirota bacterium]
MNIKHIHPQILLIANVIVMAFFGLISFNIPLVLLDLDPDALETLHYLIGAGYALTLLGAVGFVLLYYQSERNKERFKKIAITYAAIGAGPLLLASLVQLISPSPTIAIIMVVAELWGISFLIANLVAVASVIRNKQAPEVKKKKKKKVRTKKRA